MYNTTSQPPRDLHLQEAAESHRQLKYSGFGIQHSALVDRDSVLLTDTNLHLEHGLGLLRSLTGSVIFAVELFSMKNGYVLSQSSGTNIFPRFNEISSWIKSWGLKIIFSFSFHHSISVPVVIQIQNYLSWIKYLAERNILHAMFRNISQYSQE